jgi:hypothetical protein
MTSHLVVQILGRAIAQTVRAHVSNEAALVLSQITSRGICGGRSDTEAGFLPVFLFPLLILIPRTAPYSPVIRGWYNRPTSGRSTKWIQPQLTQRNFPFLLHTP